MNFRRKGPKRGTPEWKNARMRDWVMDRELPSTCEAVGHEYLGDHCAWCGLERTVPATGHPLGRSYNNAWQVHLSGMRFWTLSDVGVHDHPEGEGFRGYEDRPITLDVSTRLYQPGCTSHSKWAYQGLAGSGSA